MSEPIGHRRWAIAEGWIPDYSHGPEPAMLSHETACLLNVSDEEAHVEITLFFKDRDPPGRTARRCRPGGRSTCASTTSRSRSRCRARPTTRA